MFQLNKRVPPKILIMLALLAIILVVAGTVFVLKEAPFEKQSSPPPVTQQPTEQEPQPGVSEQVAALASGKQTYSIQVGQPRNPQIKKVTVDPLDVGKNQEQEVEVNVLSRDSNTITNDFEVQATVITDSKRNTFPLTLRHAGGAPNLESTWDATWKREDSYRSNYKLEISAKNSKGQHSITLTFR